MLNWILSVMVHKGQLAIEEAEHLANELAVKTHPSRFIDAHRIVEAVMKDFNK